MEKPSSDPAVDSIHLPWRYISRKGGNIQLSKMIEAVSDLFGCDQEWLKIFKEIWETCGIISGIQIDLERLIYLLGQYFQITDDYINLKCEDYSKVKGFADDISEGKLSFPIVHAINKCPNDKTILTILKMKTQDVELKKLVIDYLEEAGSFKYTKQVLNDLIVEIRDELNKFDHNPSIKKFASTVFLDVHRLLMDAEEEEISDKLSQK